MELVTSIWAFVTESIMPHWPFIWPFLTSTIVSMVVGQFMQRRVWTSKNAAKSKVISLGRTTIPLHPILVGIATGIVWDDPCGVEWRPIASVSYFTLSGIIALVGYMFIDRWLERKFGVDIDVIFDEPQSIPPRAPKPKSDGPA